VFTDSKAGRVKQYNPVDNSVSILLGSGLDRSHDGTDKTCSFAQVKGICTLENTLFVTDVSAGAIKLVTGLAGTITFLKMLGCLYESFGIHSKVSKGMSVGNASSLENAKENLAKVNKYVQDIVTKVKEHYHMKESSVTNGPEGTISHQTQTSLNLLNKGINRLCKNLTDINPRFADDVALESLLTTQVENLHAVSHFKHETFSVLQYAQYESLKRTTKWAAKYYTHDMPKTTMPLKAIKVMAPLPSEIIPRKMEAVMKDWLESYRPVRQRTVHSETTKDKAGALPPAVYMKTTKSSDPQSSKVHFPEDQIQVIQPTSNITFVDESNVAVLKSGKDETELQIEQIDEYETDSDDGAPSSHNEDNEFGGVSELPIRPASVTRSGRAVKAILRLDL
jgi:hypothetical protein